jgi:hypothetical protein
MPAPSESGSQKRKPYRSVQVAKEYLLGYPAASNEDVIKATGCSPRAVTRARQYLVTTNQIQRSYFDRTHRQAGPVPDPAAPTGPNEADGLNPGPLDPAALARAVQSDTGAPLTLDQMKQRYSAIARYGQKMNEFTLEIQAMQALGRLEAQTGAKDRLGPGIPLTRADKVTRVSQILDAAGPSIVAESVIAVYEKPEFDKFVDEMGRFLAKGTKNGVEVAQNRPESDSTSVVSNPLPWAADSAAKVGRSDGNDRGEAGSGPGSGSYVAGDADAGGDSGEKGS